MGTYIDIIGWMTSIPKGSSGSENIVANCTGDSFGQLLSKIGNRLFSPYSLIQTLTIFSDLHPEAAAAELLPFIEKGEDIWPILEAFAVANAAMSSTTDGVSCIIGNLRCIRVEKLRDRFYEKYGERFVFNGIEVKKFVEDFVDINTKGMIHYSPDYTPDLYELLVNTLYFKADWETKFKPYDTRDDVFTRLDGSEITVPTMYQTHKFAYFRRDGYAYLSMPYVDTRFRLDIILPDAGKTGLLDIIPQTLVTDARKVNIEVYLPKFTQSAEIRVSDLGIKTGVDLIHKTKIIVDEEGTTMTAVTAIALCMPFVFRADHAFRYVLYFNKIVLATGVYDGVDS